MLKPTWPEAAAIPSCATDIAAKASEFVAAQLEADIIKALVAGKDLLVGPVPQSDLVADPEATQGFVIRQGARPTMQVDPAVPLQEFSNKGWEVVSLQRQHEVLVAALLAAGWVRP